MSRLDLEQQRKRAKELLRAHRRGDSAAAERFQRHLPRAAKLPLAQVRALEVQLADAQLVVAREAGFATWPRMKRFVEHAGLDEPAVSPLDAAVLAGDATAVRAVLEAGVRMWQTREAIEDAIARGDRDVVRALLDHGAWVDFAGRRWGRWGGGLHAAILLGRDAELIELLVRGTPGGTRARIDRRDRDGRTPLAIAVRTAHDAAAAVLRAHGASDAEVGDPDRALGACVRGERPAARLEATILADHQHLCWAIRSGRGAVVPALLALGLDPGVADDDGETALHLAVAARDVASVEALLAAGAPPDGWNYRNETPLSRAMRDPDDAARTALTAALAAAGATAGDRDDLSELFEDAVEAIVTGDLARLRGLLDREPRLITARSLHDHRAMLLHYVGANGVERQHSPPNAAAIAQLLLDRGADPNALAQTYGGGPGQTALYLAATSIHPVTAGVMEDLIATLVRGGAKLEHHDRSLYGAAQWSALPALVAAGLEVDLWLAAMLGRDDDVRRFVHPDGTLAPGAKLGSDREVPDREILDRALLAACHRGHRAIAELLVDAGASLAAADGQGMTALHHAAWQAHLDLVRLLIARGAPLEARNAYGGTVLDFVVWVIRNQWRPDADYPALVELLIAAGADLAAVDGVPTGRAEVDAVFARHRLC